MRRPTYEDLEKRLAAAENALAEHQRCSDSEGGLAGRPTARRQSIVAAIGQIALANNDPAHLFDKTVDLVSNCLGLDYASVWVLDSQENTFKHAAGIGWNDDCVGRVEVAAETDSPLAYALLTGEPFVIEDLLADERFSGPQALFDHQVASGAGVIIGKPESPLGVLCVFSRDARSFETRELDFLRAVSTILAGAILNRQVWDGLAESEERFRDVVTASSDWFWEQDAEFKFTYVSGRVFDFTGFPPEYFIGKTRWDAVEELDDYKDIWAIHRRTVESHKPFRDFRYTFSGADGQTHHVSISGKPVFDESGGFTGYRGVGRDLTDAVELERAATQAHMRLIEAIDSLSLGFALFDQEDKLVLFNVRYRELCDTADEPIISMRIKFEDLLRKAISAGVLSDEMGAAEEQFENRMRLHQNLPSLHEQKIADGRWLEIHEFPAHDGGVVTVMEDITEQKRYEDSLQDRERELSEIVEISTDRLWFTDTDHQFTNITVGSAKDHAEPPVASSIGRTRWDIVGADPEADTLWSAHRENMDNHRPFRDFVYSATDADDNTTWWSVGGNPVFDEAGAFSGYRGVAKNISLIKQAESDLVQASKLATLGEMASAIAHELNQPLSVVSMATESAMAELDGDGTDLDYLRNKLRTVLEQRDRMAGIINHMRLFSRKEAGEFRPFDPNTVVNDAIQLVNQQFKGVGIQFAYDVPTGVGDVLGQPLQLEQVILNLLTNARHVVLQRSEKMAETGTEFAPFIGVFLTLERGGNDVIIAVSDNGGGIPEDAFPKLFDPFFTTKPEGLGTGLGLSISYSIIAAMNGHMEVFNQDDGAVFRIVLPVYHGNSIVPAASDRFDATRMAGRKIDRERRILLVDDEEAIIEEMSDYLKRKGYVVDTAANGEEALDKFALDVPDVLITDLNMPKLNGHELLRRVVQTSPGLPVIIMTGHTTFGEDEAIVAEGAKIVLKKTRQSQGIDSYLG